MKQPNSLVKLAAVVSSVLLVSAFICYRAGAFHWLMAAPAPAASGNNPADPNDIMFSGSKSMEPLFVIPTADVPAAPPSSAQPAPTILPGSKRGEIFTPADTPGAQPPSPASPAAPPQQPSSQDLR